MLGSSRAPFGTPHVITPGAFCWHPLQGLRGCHPCIPVTIYDLLISGSKLDMTSSDGIFLVTFLVNAQSGTFYLFIYVLGYSYFLFSDDE